MAEVTIPGASISQVAGLAAVHAAVAKGLEMGCRVNAAVVDGGGNLVAFLRADGAFLPSIAIAQDKAYTAAGFGMATDRLYRLIEGSPALRDGILKRERVAAFPGGLPIHVDGLLVGAIGVSGGSEEEDLRCAEAGVAAIGAHPAA